MTLQESIEKIIDDWIVNGAGSKQLANIIAQRLTLDEEKIKELFLNKEKGERIIKIGLDVAVAGQGYSNFLNEGQCEMIAHAFSKADIIRVKE